MLKLMLPIVAALLVPQAASAQWDYEQPLPGCWGSCYSNDSLNEPYSPPPRRMGRYYDNGVWSGGNHVPYYDGPARRGGGFEYDDERNYKSYYDHRRY